MKHFLSWLCALGLCAANSAALERPNILLILVDDLRADALGHAGHPFFESPSIDRLAAEGARFDDAFVVTSLCSPSRATILSGLYAHEHGVRGIWDSLPDSTRIFVDELREAGYDCAWVGKWHLSEDSAPHRSFDRWVSFRGQGAYPDPLLNVDGEPLRAKGHLTDVLTEHAIRFLEEPRERPFFLALSHRAAHTPYLAQHRHHGRYDRVRLRLPESSTADRDGKPGFLECRSLDLDGYGRIVRGYFELLAGVDESVGQLLSALEEIGELDRTLIIFTSDNGYLLGEHGLADKRVAYEESMRVPLILRYPQWFDGGLRVGGTLALNLDIAATILEAARIARPPRMRGLSLRAQAAGESRRPEFLYSYEREDNRRNPRARCTPTILALRTLDEKSILYPLAGEAPEYYHLGEDPHELHNLAAEPAHARRAAILRERIWALADSLGYAVR